MPSKSVSPSDVLRWLQSQTGGLWPAVLGSLSLRRSPCVRENYRACLTGEQHQSYVLYGRLKGRLFADRELMQQGAFLERFLQTISDFLDDHEEIIETVRGDQ